ncbi:MAG: hypothetical protein ACOYXO_03290 [Chloroflexota bacterium]
MSSSDGLRFLFALFALLVLFCGITWVITIPAYRYRSKLCGHPHALTDWLFSPFYLLVKILYFVLMIMIAPLVILIAIPLLPFLVLFRKISNWVNRLLEALTNPEKYVIFFQRMIRLGLWIQFIPDSEFLRYVHHLEKQSKTRDR